MTNAIRLTTTAAANAAYDKPKSKRSARDWQAIVDHESAAIEIILLAELDDAYGKFRATTQEFKKLLDEALRLLVDHPAAIELRRRAEDAKKKARLIASEPRKRTQKLRAADASMLRDSFEAAKKAGKARGWKKRTALDYGVSTKTLNKIVFSPPERASGK